MVGTRMGGQCSQQVLEPTEGLAGGVMAGRSSRWAEGTYDGDSPRSGSWGQSRRGTSRDSEGRDEGRPSGQGTVGSGMPEAKEQ